MISLFSRRFIVAAIIVAIGAILFNISFFQENKEAYLFPSIIASTILFFSLTSLFREAFSLCADDFEPTPIIRLIPIIVIMTSTVFLVEHVGMYSTSFVALFLISAWYSPQEPLSKRVISSLLLSIGFILFMYLLFTVMLGVQVPRGFLI